MESFVLGRTFMLGDGSAIVGKAIGAVAESPATTGGTPIPILVIKSLDFIGV